MQTMSEKRLQRLKVVYGIALAVIALTMLSSYFMMEHTIQRNAGDSRVINLSGRQRMLSQRLTKCVLALERRGAGEEQASRLTEISISFAAWKTAHLGLQRGDQKLGLPARRNSAAVTALFAEMEPFHAAMIHALEELLAQVKEGSLERNTVLATAEVMLRNEPRFLELMDKITFQFDLEARERVGAMLGLEQLILGVGLLVLLVEFLLVFRPSLSQLAKMMTSLRQRSTQLQEINGRLRESLEAMRESEEKHRAVAEELTCVYQNAPAIIMLMDSQRRVRKVNHSAADFSGHPVGDMIGRRAGDVLHCLHAIAAPEGCGSGVKCGECLVRRPVMDTLETGHDHQHVEATLPFLVDGRENKAFFLLSTTRLLLHHEPMVLVSIMDITERKQLEEETEELQAKNRQLEKNESLNRMAGAIAHLFNNQLQAVIGNIELAMEEPRQNASEVAMLAAAMQAARKAAEISKLMLVYVGQGVSRQEPTDLAGLCRQNLPELQGFTPNNVAIETDFPIPGPVISANANQIQQILANLVTNAWESVETGTGSISLTVKTVAAAAIPATHRFPLDWQPHDLPYACLEVADTGCGIAPADIGKIFDPFFSSKFIGRGLGLSVTMGFVRAHDGGITVESEPGAGSRFRVFFPLLAATAETPFPPSPAPPPPNSGLVLLAEDEEEVRRVAAATLVRLGFTVLEARDGVEAVELFRSRGSEIRYAILDLVMPRLDGWAALNAIRAMRPGFPVIITSGYDEAQAMAGDHAELPQAFLSKPYDAEGMRLVINQTFAHAR